MSEGDTIPLRGSADMWRSRAKAAEAENQRLQAEVARLTKAHDVCGYLVSEIQRTATEAALRWAWGHDPFVSPYDKWMGDGRKALLGEE